MPYAEPMAFQLPRIYPILDSSAIPAQDRAEFLRDLGSSLAEAGVTLLEYRNKTGSDAEIVADAAILRAAMPPTDVKLILDDRVDLVVQIEFDGVHVDTGDVTPSVARATLGHDRIIGTFGGSEALVPGVFDQPVDYLSIGPVFRTRTKQTSKPPIGLEGVRRLRAEAGSDAVLVAVGGITLATAPDVIVAGANIIAAAGAIFRGPDPSAEFRRWIEVLG